MSTDIDHMKVLERMRERLEREYREALLVQTDMGMRLARLDEELLTLARALDSERKRRES